MAIPKVGRLENTGVTITKGPGEYRYTRYIESTLQKNQPSTFAKSFRTNTVKEPNPGPTDYTTNLDVIKAKSSRAVIPLGRVKDEIEQKAELPGVGSYNILYNRKHAYCPIFSTAKEIKPKLITPGPGSYEIKTSFPAMPAYRNSHKAIIGK